jgi:hypothetical protein
MEIAGATNRLLMVLPRTGARGWSMALRCLSASHWHRSARSMGVKAAAGDWDSAESFRSAKTQ